MFQLKPSTKTAICIGTGGVGKTTFATMLALGKASEGQKVLVLTIDPSLRLAQALGLPKDGEVHQINHSAIGKKSGQLFGCILDPKKAFQEFISSAAGNRLASADIDKLTTNKLYQELSTNLSGSQEFTSLFKLNQFVQSGQYDLVILDTPPAQHTWQFLKAPEKLSQLFNEGVAQWFRSAAKEDVGFFKKIVNAGTLQVLKALEVLTGADFVKELSLFFKAIQNWQEPLQAKVNDCHRLLTSQQTEFILVTALDSSRIQESHKISHEILMEGYNLTSLVINRSLSWLDESLASSHPKINDILNYYKQIEKNIIALSDDKRFQRLSVYKTPEVSQNDWHVETLYEVYNQIHFLR